MEHVNANPEGYNEMERKIDRYKIIHMDRDS